MTIVKSPISIADYPIERLDSSFVAALNDAVESYQVSKASRRKISQFNINVLDCYCDLIDVEVGLDDVHSEAFGDIISGFLGAIKGGSLVNYTDGTSRNYVLSFIGALRSIYENQENRIPQWLDELNFYSISPINLTESDYPVEKILHWSSWPVSSRKNIYKFLPLSKLLKSHGKKFTVAFYIRWKGFFAKRSCCQSPALVTFVDYLSSNSDEWRAETFKSPLKLSKFFRAFAKYFFQKTVDKQLNLNAQIASWNAFISNVTEIFIDSGDWAEPFQKIPKPMSRKVQRGNSHRVEKNEDGVIVHNKLLTEIPLHYTDDESIGILFGRIESDLITIKRWAKQQAYSLRKRQKNRIRLAKSGKLLDSIRGKKIGVSYEFSDVCATFETAGYEPNISLSNDHVFRNANLTKLAFDLGYPISFSLFPFMALLVIDNPSITPTFLHELELYDKHDQLVGFIKTDDGYQLTGYKDRAGPANAEQKLIVSPRSAAILRQVIEITQPIRDYLKKQGDDKWRRLFICCGRNMSRPTTGVTLLRPFPRPKVEVKKSSSISDELEAQFSKFTDLRGQEFRRYCLRITLSALRASAGVLVYLKTNSVHEMARALGHKSYDGHLLSHYLPESILAFFQTRWIRIFQRGIICEAMKDSPHLLKVANFENIFELHRFLANHAIKDIPEHLSDPEKASENNSVNAINQQVLISIDPGILAALLSLKLAVERAKNTRNISGLALYWSKISGLVEREILRGSDTLLHQHLEKAMENIDPQRMEKLIYEPTA